MSIQLLDKMLFIETSLFNIDTNISKELDEKISCLEQNIIDLELQINKTKLFMSNNEVNYWKTTKINIDEILAILDNKKIQYIKQLILLLNQKVDNINIILNKYNDEKLLQEKINLIDKIEKLSI